MSEWQGKRYWLVGASEGLGRAVARRLSASGVELVLSARSEDRLADLVPELPGKATALAVDVADRAAVEAAAAQIGPLDGLVYLAGVYWPMKAQDWDSAQVEQMIDINFVGAARCVGAVLPAMLEKDAGSHRPDRVALGISRAAWRDRLRRVKGGHDELAESMQADLQGHRHSGAAGQSGLYQDAADRQNDFDMPFIMEPEAAGQEFFEHMSDGGFRKNFPFLFSTMFRLGAVCCQIGPTTAWSNPSRKRGCQAMAGLGLLDNVCAIA